MQNCCSPARFVSHDKTLWHSLSQHTRSISCTLPHNSAARAGFDETKVLITPENCCIDSRSLISRLATLRVLRLAFSASNSAVKIITSEASGTVLNDWRRALSGGVNLPWNSPRAFSNRTSTLVMLLVRCARKGCIKGSARRLSHDSVRATMCPRSALIGVNPFCFVGLWVL